MNDFHKAATRWDNALDVLRGAAVFWVLVIHCLYWSPNAPGFINVLKPFFLVEMPVLFFVTGAAASRTPVRRYFLYLKKRAARILLPYWAFAVVGLLYCVYISQSYPFGKWFYWLCPILVTPKSDPEYLVWHLWFIPVYLATIAIVPVMRVWRAWAAGLPCRQCMLWLPIMVCVFGLAIIDSPLISFKNLIPSLVRYVLSYSIWVYLGLGWGEKGLGVGITFSGWRRVMFLLSGCACLLSIVLLLILKGVYQWNMQLNKFPPNLAFTLWQGALFFLYPLIWPTVSMVLKSQRLATYLKLYSDNGYTIYLWHVWIFWGIKYLLVYFGWWDALILHPTMTFSIYFVVVLGLSPLLIPIFGFIENYSRSALGEKNFFIAASIIGMLLLFRYYQ